MGAASRGRTECFLPPGCLPSLVTLVQSSLCSSPPLGAGGGAFLFCFWRLVFLLPHVSWQALTSVACWPEGMFWSCQDGRRLGLANPGRRCSILPVPRHSVKEPRGATSPGLCFPTSRVLSVPSATTRLSTDCGRRRGCGGAVGGSPLEEQAPQVWVPVSVPGACARGPLGAWW